MKLNTTKIAAAAVAAIALFTSTPAEAQASATRTATKVVKTTAKKTVAKKVVAKKTVVKKAAVKPTSTVKSAAVPALGIIGNYSDADMTNLRTAGGASDVLVEMSWAQAEPTKGVYNEQYFASIAKRISTLKALGYTISFNTGVHEAPAWLLNSTGARFVDQNGGVYTDSPEPNLVFGTRYRYLAERYLTTVFARLGDQFSLVRVGGGHWGELTYPSKVNPSTGKIRNLYYAYDVYAQQASPVKGWKPGQPSPNGEAGKFLRWYLTALADYQNWQITALRTAGFAGNAAVLYPSYGMRTGDLEKAVATNLNGTSSPEINGEVQRGFDMARQVNALKDKNVIVYGTWAESNATVTYLAGLAKAKGLKTMAETSHDMRVDQMPLVMAQAQKNNLAALYIVRQKATEIVKATYLIGSVK
ncbi:beta-galactosidase [Actinoplanes sp. NPDC051859]|uniref:beta-galactosidase n=1 Tax=Actinoplanes sp. NPDC051859 TaxID=3363909 RepID=UPI00379B265E